MPTIHTAHLPAIARSLLAIEPTGEGSGDQSFAAQFSALLGAAGKAAGTSDTNEAAAAPESAAARSALARPASDSVSGKPGGKILPDRRDRAADTAVPARDETPDSGDANVAGEIAAAAGQPADTQAFDSSPMLPSTLVPLAMLPAPAPGDQRHDAAADKARAGMPAVGTDQRLLIAPGKMRREAALPPANPVADGARRLLTALAAPSHVAMKQRPIPDSTDAARPTPPARPSAPSQDGGIVIPGVVMPLALSPKAARPRQDVPETGLAISPQQAADPASARTMPSDTVNPIALERAKISEHLPAAAPFPVSDTPAHPHTAAPDGDATPEPEAAPAKASDAFASKPLAAPPERLGVPDNAALAPPAQTAAVTAAATSAAAAHSPAPHDFAALVDRLVEARQAAQTTLSSQTVHAAVNHAEFGQVSLQFQQDAAGLSVTLASGDPDLARAVQAAAPANQPGTGFGSSDSAAAQRQDTSGQSAHNGGQSQSQLHQQRAASPQHAAETQHGTASEPRRNDRSGPQSRSGIFA